MDKGRMDALVQAATLVQDANAMARSHIPVKFSEKVQNLLLKVKDKERLTSSVQEYGACIDFTLSSHHEMPSPIMNKMQGVDETFRLRPFKCVQDNEATKLGACNKSLIAIEGAVDR